MMLERYLKRVAANMNLNKTQKKCLFTEIRAELEERLEDQILSDYSKVVEILGQPEDFARDLSEMEPFVNHSVTIKKSHNRLRLAVIVAILLAVGITICCIKLALTQPGYYFVELQ